MSILDQSSQALGGVLDPIAAKIKNPFNKGVPKDGLMPADFTGGFNIVEYVNGFPQISTKLQLLGNMMPFIPFHWDGEQRLVKEFYPGNPEVNIQVLGPKEGDLIIQGRFKDKHFKDASYYGAAYAFATALDEIRKRGNLLKFGLYGITDDWIRWGFLEKVDFKMNRLSWIDYELTFVVVGKKQPINNYFASPEKASPNAVNQNLINSVTKFQETYSAAPTTMPQSLAGFMNDITSGVASNINKVTGFIGSVISTVSDIKSAANRALGLIKNVKVTLKEYQRQLGTISNAFNRMSGQGNASGQFRDTYKNISFVNGVRASIHEQVSFLAQMQAQILAIAKTLPIGRYKVVTGDTLQKIASKFYGSPDNWKLIYDHNKLTSTALTAGRVLEIPRT